jgi:leucyl/phenylalanyl-tRNA---protein transferase
MLARRRPASAGEVLPVAVEVVTPANAIAATAVAALVASPPRGSPVTVRRMPTEPPPCAWTFPPPDAAGEDGLLALGADLEPGTLLTAYRAGIFPMPIAGVPEVAWFSPDPRAIVPLDAFSPSRSLRRSARRFGVTADRAFGDVVAGCADPRRPGGWITPAVRAAYERLHELGWAHSIEVWDAGGALAGGLYGVEIGGLFAAESKFHVRTDASKVALAALVERLRAAGAPRLLDVQWTTPHLRSLGAVDIPRAEYLARLPAALDAPPAFP